MRLVLLGPPGSGKGTQANFMQARYGVTPISTGDMLREEVAADTQIGRQVGPIMSNGSLVPDDIMIDMVAKRIAKDDCANGFLLDGFPRSVEQAKALDKELAQQSKPLDAALYLDVDQGALSKRILKRAFDQKAKTGGQRADDNVQTISARLNAFNTLTAQLLPYYQGKNILHTIDGNGSIEQTRDSIFSVLDVQKLGLNDNITPQP